MAQGRNGAFPGDDQHCLRSEDVFGAVAALNFADLTSRVVFTADFVNFGPLLDEAELANRSEISLQELSRE